MSGGGFAMVPTTALRDRQLSDGAKVLLAMLCTYRNASTGECFPSLARLAIDLEINHRNTQKRLKELVDRGYVQVLPRRSNDGGRQKSNAFRINFGMGVSERHPCGENCGQPVDNTGKEQVMGVSGRHPTGVSGRHPDHRSDNKSSKNLTVVVGAPSSGDGLHEHEAHQDGAGRTTHRKAAA